tara:strand:- start:3209 stop:4402 length:1194 start_codon:yes stop_codon:yes gene_type:complete
VSEEYVEHIVVNVPEVQPQTPCHDVMKYFEADEELLVVAVLEDRVPVGLVYRVDFIQTLAARFGYSLYEKRPVRDLMTEVPLIIDADNSLDFVINLLVTKDTHDLLRGFVICRGDEYLGIGTALSLLQAQNERAAGRAEELLRAKNAAEEANRSKSEFLANMNHELRTPLNAIIGFSEIMQQGLYGQIAQHQYKEYIDIVNKSGLHLLGTINSILEMSKIEAGMLEISENDFALYDVFEDAGHMVRMLARKKNIEIRCGCEEVLTDFYGDEGVLRQVMLNLLSNAIKFSPPDTVISLSARRQPTGDVCVAVTDQGIGIAEDDIEKILTPFYQVDSSYARTEEGTGLGLSIVQKYLELHQASLTITSAVGQGTTVSFTLPAARFRDVPVLGRQRSNCA